MKFHPPITQIIIQALRDTFEDGRHADKVIQYHFKNNRKLGKRDRAQIAEAVYGIVRWWRKLWFIAKMDASCERNKLLEVYKIWLILNGIDQSVVEQGLGPLSCGNTFDDRVEKSRKIRSINESVPEWIDQIGESQLADRWPDVLASLNKTAEVILRANSLKISRDQLLERLIEKDVDCEAIGDEGIRLLKRRNVFALDEFKQGLFEVQDASSQRVAPLLDLQPGQRVIDACAGAGGKSLHIAALMQDKGRILSLDIHEHKLKELKTRAKRNGISCIETRPITSTKVVKRLAESADRLLLDVPCSGLGVLRRNPDTKWKLQPEQLEELLLLQQKILVDYSKMVKPGGRMVYATCSILPGENSQQVDEFLKGNDQWQLVEQIHLYPDQSSGDGFYAAALQRR